MSLNAREQQALAAIEQRLAASDPKLASLLTTFSRLTSGEEMPLREKLRAGWWRATRRHPGSRRHPPAGRARRRYARLGWRRAMLLLWLLTALALTATAVALSHASGRRTCVQPLLVSCAGSPPVHHQTAGTSPMLPR